jgi:hypothetical protein
MGITQGDALFKRVIELMLEDIRHEPWLIDHIFSQLKTTSILAQKHGQKEIENIKDWFKSNKINVFMNKRLDSLSYPCVVIKLGNSIDREDLRTFADQDLEVMELDPQEIDKPIAYIVSPFDIVSYDDSTKIVTFPDSITTEDVGTGMLLVDPSNGNAYTVEEIIGNNSVKILDTLDMTGVTRIGVFPQYPLYRARIEARTFEQEYVFECKAHGEPAYAIWLHDVVLYGLLRYNEALIEGNGFQLAGFQSTDIVKDATGGDNTYMRTVKLNGLAKMEWVKSPTRIIEVAKIKDSESETASPAGIKILSNLDDQIADECSPWQTIEDDEISD